MLKLPDRGGETMEGLAGRAARPVSEPSAQGMSLADICRQFQQLESLLLEIRGRIETVATRIEKTGGRSLPAAPWDEAGRTDAEGT